MGMKTNPTKGDMALLKTDKFRYEYSHNGTEWERIETEERQEYMVRQLKSAYIQLSLIVTSMQEGIEVRTMFAIFRAIPIDEDSG